MIPALGFWFCSLVCAANVVVAYRNNEMHAMGGWFLATVLAVTNGVFFFVTQA